MNFREEMAFLLTEQNTSLDMIYSSKCPEGLLQCVAH